METDFFFDFVYKTFVLFLNDQPLLLLQAAGLIGIVCVLLLFGRRSLINSHIGIVFGMINLIMAALLESWIQGAIKPFLRNDLLFMAGFFGGWRNASYAFALTWLGRFLFGGSGNIGAATIDLVIITYGATLLRFFFTKNTIATITHKTIIAIMFARALITALPLLLLYAGGVFPSATSLHLLIMRITSNFTISILIFYAIVLLLRRELTRENQIYVDPITALPNRRALQLDLKKQIEHQENAQPQSLLIIEIDSLADLIQESGHEEADSFLHTFGQELKTVCNASALLQHRPLVYSFSDFSFAIIMHGITMHDIQEKGFAHALYGRLLCVQKPLSFQQATRLTIGVIDIDLNETETAFWLLRSLNVMEKKQDALVHFFESSISRQIELENWLYSQIDGWIRKKTVPLEFQPKVTLMDSRCNGAEALIRIQDRHARNRYIHPSLVFKVAKEHALLIDLDRCVVQTAANYLKKLPSALSELTLAVNISAESFSRPDFCEKVRHFLVQNNIPGKRLIFNIADGHHLPLSGTVQDNFTSLSQYGISVSLDGFGSGTGALSLLSKLPFREFRLDYGMLANLDVPSVREMLILCIDGAKRCTAHIVAEGIENEKQHQFLLRMGVMYGQGSLFGDALPFEEFVHFSLAQSVTIFSQNDV